MRSWKERAVGISGVLGVPGVSGVRGVPGAFVRKMEIERLWVNCFQRGGDDEVFSLWTF